MDEAKEVQETVLKIFFQMTEEFCDMFMICNTRFIKKIKLITFLIILFYFANEFKKSRNRSL